MAKHVAKYRRDKNHRADEGVWCVYEQRSVNSFEFVKECGSKKEAETRAMLANKMNRVGEEA